MKKLWWNSNDTGFKVVFLKFSFNLTVYDVLLLTISTGMLWFFSVFPV